MTACLCLKKNGHHAKGCPRYIQPGMRAAYHRKGLPDLEAYQRNLRHAAHEYHVTNERIRGGHDVVDAYAHQVEANLYDAARLLTLRELIAQTAAGGITMERAVARMLDAIDAKEAN